MYVMNVINVHNFSKYYYIRYMCDLFIFDQGRFQSFGQGGARWRAKRAENFWPPPVNFWPPPAGGGPIFTGGCQPLILKHINIGLTYDLLIVIYHLL